METPSNIAESGEQTPSSSHLSWQTLKPWVLGVLGVATLITLVTGTVLTLGEAAQNRIQSEYMQITDEASRANFAKRHSQHPLGGLVLLQQA